MRLGRCPCTALLLVAALFAGRPGPLAPRALAQPESPAPRPWLAEPSAPQAPQQGKWTVQASGVSQTLRAVHFADEEHGWVVGGESEGDVVILHTSNGGARWQAQTSPIARRLYSVAFWDSRRGWAAGEVGALVRTDDGGRTWHAQNSGTSSTIVGLAVIGRDTVVAAVRTGHVRRSTNGGASWARVQGTSGIGLFAIAFPDATNGWISGSEGLIARSSDGGVNWVAQSSPSSGRVADIDFADANNGWAVGNSVMHTTDGATWRMQSRPDPEQKSLNAVDAVDARTAFAVGDEARAFSTRDGGATWVRETLPRRVSLNGVHFPSDCRGWAVGWGGSILHYSQPCVLPPTAVPPTATATRTPRPTLTPTATLTPTPSAPWARWRTEGPLLVSEAGTGRARVVYGSIPLPVVVTGTVTGAATFVGGRDTFSAELFVSAGTYDVVLAPRPGAAAGDALELAVELGGVRLRRSGVIARSLFLPTLGR